MYKKIKCDKDLVKDIILSGYQTAKIVLSAFKKTKMYDPDSELSSIRVCTFLFDKGVNVIEIRWDHNTDGTEILVGSNGELHKCLAIPESPSEFSDKISDIIYSHFTTFGFSTLEARELGC